jgi:predicted DNA-binding transcriptional regulator YafY
MRADRLLSILLLLQVHQRITAQELAKRLEVSERTIHRDMEALSAAGIPVTADRGVGGGWSLLEEYRTNLTGLTETEARTLFFTRPARLLEDLGLHEASEAALIKLHAALPSIQRDNAERAYQCIHVDTTGWKNPDEAVPYLPILQEAIWQERKLQLTYLRPDDAIVERLIDPLGLVAKGSTWYLVAAVDGEYRTYRVSRIQAACKTDQHCERPKGFHLAKHWEQSAAHFRANLPRFPVKLLVDPTIIGYMRIVSRYSRIEQVGEAQADGRVEVSMLFEGEQIAREYILGFGVKIEVIEPRSLRKQVIQAAKDIVSFYASDSTDLPDSADLPANAAVS